MGNADAAAVVAKVALADYAPLFKQVYGESAFGDSGKAYDQIADAIASFERTKLFSPFSSKYDAYLEGKVQLSESEKRGLELFNDEKKGNCAACHPSDKQEDGSHPLFTDYSYDNIGVPKLKENPFYHVDAKFNPDGDKVVDLGLGAIVKKPEENGKFKVPTLRNIALTGPYMHNGSFKTLEEVVEFYNSRDKSTKWGKPEVSENVNKDELGDLKLNAQEVKDIVAFMKTLSDGD
jgi:cytochrome c peroxidase